MNQPSQTAAEAQPRQPRTVAALLRLLGIPDIPVLGHHTAIADWLERNDPSVELRISLRANGYGLLLPPPTRGMRPSLSAVKSITPGDTFTPERLIKPSARKSA
jgi:hypothetical protein